MTSNTILVSGEQLNDVLLQSIYYLKDHCSMSSQRAHHHHFTCTAQGLKNLPWWQEFPPKEGCHCFFMMNLNRASARRVNFYIWIYRSFTFYHWGALQKPGPPWIRSFLTTVSAFSQGELIKSSAQILPAWFLIFTNSASQNVPFIICQALQVEPSAWLFFQGLSAQIMQPVLNTGSGG